MESAGELDPGDVLELAKEATEGSMSRVKSLMLAPGGTSPAFVAFKRSTRLLRRSSNWAVLLKRVSEYVPW